MAGKRYLRSGVPSVEEIISREVSVSVVLSDRVNLFFITFDAVWRANVVPEQPGLSALVDTRHLVSDSASEQRRADHSKVAVD
jgi:hypothetical protein